jgi:hypothetical protein
MVLVCSACSISGEMININLYGGDFPTQCKSCNETSCAGCSDVIVQKRIWNQVRAPASQYTSVIQTESIVGCASNKPTAGNANVNWNQSSDRANASIQNVYRPTNGNSTKTSITRERPGSLSAGGKGVDVKHGSYARYLARKKAPALRTELIASVPVKGNKTKMFGMISGC